MRIHIVRENIFARSSFEVDYIYIYIYSIVFVNDIPVSTSQKISCQKKNIIFENPSGEYAWIFFTTVRRTNRTFLRFILIYLIRSDNFSIAIYTEIHSMRRGRFINTYIFHNIRVIRWWSMDLTRNLKQHCRVKIKVI